MDAALMSQELHEGGNHALWRAGGTESRWTAACWGRTEWLLAHGRRGFCFTGEMHPNDRSRLTFMMRYAARHPERIVPHARRLARDAVLRLRHRDHVSYYRAVMRSDAARGGGGGVGSHTPDSWSQEG